MYIGFISVIARAFQSLMLTGALKVNPIWLMCPRAIRNDPSENLGRNDREITI